MSVQTKQPPQPIKTVLLISAARPTRHG